MTVAFVNQRLHCCAFILFPPENYQHKSHAIFIIDHKILHILTVVSYSTNNLIKAAIISTCEHQQSHVDFLYTVSAKKYYWVFFIIEKSIRSNHSYTPYLSLVCYRSTDSQSRLFLEIFPELSVQVEIRKYL